MIKSEFKNFVLDTPLSITNRFYDRKMFISAVEAYLSQKYRFIYLGDREPMTLDNIAGNVENIEITENNTVDIFWKPFYNTPNGKIINAIELGNFEVYIAFIGKVNEENGVYKVSDLSIHNIYLDIKNNKDMSA